MRVPNLIPVPDFRVSHFQNESGSLRSWKDDRARGTFVAAAEPPRETSGDAISAAKNYSICPLILPVTQAMKEALFESFRYEPITAVHTIYGVN